MSMSQWNRHDGMKIHAVASGITSPWVSLPFTSYIGSKNSPLNLMNVKESTLRIPMRTDKSRSEIQNSQICWRYDDGFFYEPITPKLRIFRPFSHCAFRGWLVFRSISLPRRSGRDQFRLRYSTFKDVIPMLSSKSFFDRCSHYRSAILYYSAKRLLVSCEMSKTAINFVLNLPLFGKPRAEMQSEVEMQPEMEGNRRWRGNWRWKAWFALR
jgi:hypothetical protein